MQAWVWYNWRWGWIPRFCTTVDWESRKATKVPRWLEGSILRGAILPAIPARVILSDSFMLAPAGYPAKRRVSVGTGWLGASIPWLAEIASLTCNIYLRVTARKINFIKTSPKGTLCKLLRHWTTKKQSHGLNVLSVLVFLTVEMYSAFQKFQTLARKETWKHTFKH